MSARTGLSLARLRTQLSERDFGVLRSVDSLRFVSGRHLQTLFFDGHHHTERSASRSCRRVLVRLTELGVLRRLDRTVGGVNGGSSSHVYSVGPAGYRLLDDPRARLGFREPSDIFLDHYLAVANLFASIVDTANKGEVQIIRYQTEPECWREVPGYGLGDTLRPDLFLVLARGDYEWHHFVEVDRGTEYRTALRRKFRHYMAYYRSGAEAEMGIFPLVAWLTTSETRAETLRAIAEETSGDVPLFEVGLLTNPLPVLAPGGMEP